MTPGEKGYVTKLKKRLAVAEEQARLANRRVTRLLEAIRLGSSADWKLYRDKVAS